MKHVNFVVCFILLSLKICFCLHNIGKELLSENSEKKYKLSTGMISLGLKPICQYLVNIGSGNVLFHGNPRPSPQATLTCD